jgi:hydrogenase maturation protease
MTGILVAGVGNIFHGDDAFGVEVAQRLSRRRLPPEVTVIDFGIRAIDLTYALLDGYSAGVLVDAAPRGERPGTISVIEPEQAGAGEASLQDLMLSPHELDPAKVFRLVAALGGGCKRILLVACEPLTLGGEEGILGLSEPVAAALDAAVMTVEDIVHGLMRAPAWQTADGFVRQPQRSQEGMQS